MCQHKPSSSWCNPFISMSMDPLGSCSPRSVKNLPCSSNSTGTSCCLSKLGLSLRGMMLQLYHCLIFTSLGTPADHFPVGFGSFQIPLNQGRAVWSRKKPEQPKSALPVHFLPAYTTLLLQTSSGKGHQEEEQPPKDARILKFQEKGGSFCSWQRPGMGQTNPSPQNPRAGSAPPKPFLQFSTGQSSWN